MALKPVHALVGNDLFLQLEKLAELQRAAGKEAQRIDVDGETAQLGDVLDELRSFAMFSASKFVVVRNADEFIKRYREQVEEYVQKPAAGSVLVLRVSSLPSNQRIYKYITANGQVHECEAPKSLREWIVNRAKSAHQLAIKPDAAALLLDLVGADLGRLDNELAKLAIQTNGVADAKTVSEAVSFQREQEMWDMTNEVAAGNIGEALRRWRHLCQLDSSAEFRAVTWLGMWLEKVRRALQLRREGKNDFAIAKELKIWPMDQQKPFFQTASSIGENGAGRLIELLTDIDYRSKNGLGDMKENVERFLLSVKEL
jgi:DNA polymerase-3 subunit delta